MDIDTLYGCMQPYKGVAKIISKDDGQQAQAEQSHC